MTPLALALHNALAAHDRQPAGRVCRMANLTGHQQRIGPGDRVVMLAGPDAGTLGLIPPADRPAQPGAGSLAVILDGGRMVIVPREWVGAPV